ncbi:integrase-like protein [Paraburkholderia sp. BL6669N2]|nr:integrase-like protein [Paraburkholderia sp. BL6669N2]
MLIAYLRLPARPVPPTLKPGRTGAASGLCKTALSGYAYSRPAAHAPPSTSESTRRHDGRVAVDQSNARWCSDGFEFRCDDGSPLRVSFAPDCCDREAMSWAATTGGYTGDMVRDVMLQAVENRFDGALKADNEIEWLSDNGSCYIAEETLTFSKNVGLKPITTPVRSPLSNGMAESFVKTMKRDYVRGCSSRTRERRCTTWPSRLTTTTSRIRTAP